MMCTAKNRRLIKKKRVTILLYFIMMALSLKYIKYLCAEVQLDTIHQEILCFEKYDFLINIAFKKVMLLDAQCLLGSLARQYRDYVLHSLHCVAWIRAQSVFWWSHHFVITMAGVPCTLYHLLLCGSCPERSPEQPSRNKRFLGNSASIISINIKLIKTSAINILAFVLVSLIYLNMCSCSDSSFCPRGLN